MPLMSYTINTDTEETDYMMSKEEYEAQQELMKQPFWAMLWGRTKCLIAKVIGVKMLVFIVATILALTTQVITGWIWFSAATLLVGSRTFEKWLYKMKDHEI